jgi:hypothetical protein
MDLTMYYEVNVLDTSDTVTTTPDDPTTNNPLIKISVEFKGKKYSLGSDFTLASLRLLSGDSTEYRAIETLTESVITSDGGIPEISEDIDSYDFIIWAQRFPNSGVAGILSQLPTRP